MKPRTVVLSLTAVVLGLALLTGVWGSRRRPLGVQAGRLTPCPASPNCVSSFGKGEHTLAAVPYRGTAQEAVEAAAQVMSELPRTTLLNRQGIYVRFAVRSARLGFIDDVEFLATDDLLHFRSASRLGYDDLGVNRERMTFVGRSLRQRLGGGA